MAGFVKCIAATAVVTAIISSVGCEKKASGRPVTAEQYAAIKFGMTIEEVESLFG
jgi:hypothetical protein